MANMKEKLFSEFQAPTTQEWLDKIEVDLKGADYQKKMVWRTNEGFSMQPFYLKEDVDKLATVNALPGEFPFVRGNKKDNNPGWKIDLAQGIGAIIQITICIVFIRSDLIPVYSYCVYAVYSAVLMIIRAFKKTAIVYVQ